MTQITLFLKQSLNRDEGQLSNQIVDLLRDAISSSALNPGDRLPSSRLMATELNVARGTVTLAIELLIAEGFMETRPGAGTFVSDAAASIRKNEVKPSRMFPAVPDSPIEPDVDLPVRSALDFRPCRPSLELFPIGTWRRYLSLAGSVIPSADYADPLGDVRLRQTVVDYLRRARGLKVNLDEIIITNGAVHAMHLLSALYIKAGDRVVVENPGYPLASQTFRFSGAEIIACPVDRDGLVVERLPDRLENVKFVYTTPSHQFPTGSRLSLARRTALIEWAERRGALIIEDDYDGEFRYDVPPLAPMASMANDCVVYCGTFSKTMFPGLRIGFAIGPCELVQSLAKIRTLTEYAPNTLVQSALTGFIADGHYERHIHRMRRLYSGKRKRLTEVLADLNVGASVTGLDSGLNAMVHVEGQTASQISKNALKKGILLPSIRRYALDETVADEALIVGYAAVEMEKIMEGLRSIF